MGGWVGGCTAPYQIVDPTVGLAQVLGDVGVGLKAWLAHHQDLGAERGGGAEERADVLFLGDVVEEEEEAGVVLVWWVGGRGSGERRRATGRSRVVVVRGGHG